MKRSFKATLLNGSKVKVESSRFLSLDMNEVGAIKYSVTPINFTGEIEFTPYLDAGIKNEDTNYDELFWKILDIEDRDNDAVILSKTLKTKFYVATGMHIAYELNGKSITLPKTVHEVEKRIDYKSKSNVNQGDTLTLIKFGGYCQSMNHSTDKLIEYSQKTLQQAADLGFDTLLERQKFAWAKIAAFKRKRK